MRFEAKSYTDKNGNPFILRNAELSDASDLIRYLKVVAEETPWMIREPEEVSLTEEQERESTTSTSMHAQSTALSLLTLLQLTTWQQVSSQ